MSEMPIAEIIRIAKLMHSTSAKKALEPYANFSFTDAELLKVAYHLLGGGDDKPYGLTGSDPDHIARCLSVAKEIGTVHEYTLVLRPQPSNPKGERGSRVAWSELGRNATAPNEQTTAEQKPDISFVCQIPDPDHSPPLATFKADQDETYFYYEHPRLIGAAHGFEPAYEYPQVMVVYRGQDPVLIVRSEKNPSGALYICSLDTRGAHRNWDQISPMSRDSFIKQADKIVIAIRDDTSNRR